MSDAMGMRASLALLAIGAVAVALAAGAACSQAETPASCAELCACGGACGLTDEATCKAALPSACARPEAGPIDAGTDAVDEGPACTLARGASCSGGGCCADPGYACGPRSGAMAPVCCAPPQALCGDAGECCTPEAGTLSCEDGKCCVAEGNACKTNADCCMAAPRCNKTTQVCQP